MPGSGHELVTAGAYAYWTEKYATAKAVLVRRRPLDMSGPVEELATHTTPSGPSAFPAVVVAGGRVYWYNSDTISSVPLTGGVPQLEKSDVLARKLVADGAHVYFTGADYAHAADGVFRFPVGGGPVTQIAKAGMAGDITLTDNEVYFTDRSDNSIRKIAK